MKSQELNMTNNNEDLAVIASDLKKINNYR